MGMDLILKRGGEMLSKASGIKGLNNLSLCGHWHPYSMAHAVTHAKICMHAVAYKVHCQHAWARGHICTYTQSTGGLVTTVPTTANEAAELGEHLIKKKGGEMLAKVSGAYMHAYGVGMSWCMHHT